ncbi:MAG: riboflavin synthase, partial [Lysobacterales bacterium]
MFTGIVTTTGIVQEALPAGGDLRLLIQAGSLNLQSCRQGDSISVAGACLKMVHLGVGSFGADVSAETLAKTTLGTLRAGQRVNLELAMTLADRLGGHLVTGHVDGVARLVSRLADGRAERFVFELPSGLPKYLAQKGSVCVDGVSLTVNEAAGNTFSVCLIPHTLHSTT